MTSLDWNRELRRVLADRLAGLGFIEHSPLCFAREQDESVSILNFGGRIDGAKFKFTFTVGVRFAAIEAILRRDNNRITSPTISAPIHFLREDREYFEWEASEPARLTELVDDVIAEIKNSAMEYFRRFSSLALVERELSVSEMKGWFVQTPLQKAGILAAIALRHGRRDDAEAIVAREAAEPRNASPGKRRRVETLKAQLFSN